MSDTASFSAEDMAAAIASAGGVDPTAPFGVPKGYVPPIRTDTGFSPGNARAITPDDLRDKPYLPGDDSRLVGRGPEVIVPIQQQLIDAGLLREKFQTGVWDPATQRAYKSLLAYANQLGTTDSYALEHWTANNMGAVDPTPPARQPFVAEVSHPDDIKAAIKDALREKTGFGKIDDARLDQMVKAFQGEQVGAQRQEYDLTSTGGGGGQVVAPPSLDMFAEAEAKRVNPVGFSAHTYLDKFSAISDMLGGQNA